MKGMNLNDEQAELFISIMDNKYAKGPFLGMVGNRKAEYDINASPKTFEDVLKDALNDELLCNATLEELKKKSAVAVEENNTRSFV